MVTGSTPESENARPAATKPTAWQRARGPVLFVSLIVNLFLIGLAVGSWAHHHRHGGSPWLMGEPGPRGGPQHMGGPGVPRGFGAPPIRQAIQSLPEPDRRVFEETMRPLRPEIGREQQEVRRARQRAAEAVRAERFDRDAFLAAMAEVRQKQQAIQTRLHDGTAEALAKVSPEARRQFADQYGARPPRP